MGREGGYRPLVGGALAGAFLGVALVILCAVPRAGLASGPGGPRGTPPPGGARRDAPDFSKAAGVLEEAVARGAFPGCAVAAGTSREVLWAAGFGRLGGDEVAENRRAAPGTLYDLASLTKIVGTASVVMALVRDGKLAVEDPLARHLPEFLEQARDDAERKRRERVTIEHLLTHSSGLPPWRPLYRDASTYREVLDAALATPLANDPGEVARYSDIGIILLGEAASRAGGKPLAELERELVFLPLGMRHTLRDPPDRWKPWIAPTEKLPETEAAIRGVVHDENARAAEGLTGHAGLFSTAWDLSVFATEMLRARRGASRIFPEELARRFTTRRDLVEGSSRALGWDTPSGKSSAGDLLSRRSFGHTGFTGTSLWLDPERDLYVILLSNRVHPTRENRKIGAVRRALADAVARAVDAARHKDPGGDRGESPAG